MGGCAPVSAEMATGSPRPSRVASASTSLTPAAHAANTAHPKCTSSSVPGSVSGP